MTSENKIIKVEQSKQVKSLQKSSNRYQIIKQCEKLDKPYNSSGLD